MARPAPYRRRRTRQIGRKIIVVCEGSTEKKYFDGIRKSLRLPTLQIRVVDADGTDPLTLVKAAIALREESIADKLWLMDDQVWAVFDGDEHLTANLVRWKNAIHLARERKVNLAVSNPSFELWYLLHFQDQTANLDRVRAYHLVKKHIKNYQKSSVVWPEPLQELTPDAIDRAAGLRLRATNNGLSPYSNPTTDVDILVKALLDLPN